MKRTSVLFLLIVILSPLYAAAADNYSVPFPLPSAWTSCTQDSDCVEVAVGCNGCCHSTSVNRLSKQLYNDALKKQCEGYHGSVCECTPGGMSSTSCKQNVCTYTVCPYSSNGLWFHAHITLEKSDLPAGIKLQNIDLPEYNLDEVISDAEPVYILGEPEDWQKKMKSDFEGYKEKDRQRLKKGMVSQQQFDKNLESYDSRMAIYDLGTPWEKQYGLVRRIKIEGGQSSQFYEHSPNPGEQWAGFGKSPDAALFAKLIPGIITTSGMNRPQVVTIPPESEFKLPILWQGQVYWIHGKTSYSLSEGYMSCK